MFSLILIIGGGFSFWWFVIRSNDRPRAGTLVPEGDSGATARWRYTHEGVGTAIGLCPAERMVRLRAQFPSGVKVKDYSYDDIREWKFNISSGGMVHSFGRQSASASMGMGVANIIQKNKNESETGLFLQVRDIDHPEWQIKFPRSKQREHEIKRWMEILRQELNEGGIVKNAPALQPAELNS